MSNTNVIQNKAKAYVVSDFFNDALLEIIDNDTYEGMSPEEYTNTIFEVFKYKSETVCTPWLNRLNPDNLLTEDDLTIDDINRIVVNDIAGKYLDGNKFEPICCWTCKRPEIKTVNDKIQVIEHNIITRTYDNVIDIIKHPECVYIAKCTYNGVTYWIKVGKTGRSFNNRKRDYNNLGRFKKGSTITEIHMKRLLEAGLTVEFYGIKIPIKNSEIDKDGITLPLSENLNSNGLEQYLRNKIKTIYKKDFVENYKAK